MTKLQIIENMDMVVHNIENELKSIEILDNDKAVKTLSHTYSTMLYDLKRLTNEEFDALNIKNNILHHSVKISGYVNKIEENFIPSLLKDKKYKAVDNFTTACGKMKKIVEDVAWMTKEYQENGIKGED